jgi:hypothetical protein
LVIDVCEVQIVGLDTLAKKVIFNVDMFDTGVEKRVFREGLGSGIVTGYKGGGGLRVVNRIE